MQKLCQQFAEGKGQRAQNQKALLNKQPKLEVLMDIPIVERDCFASLRSSRNDLYSQGDCVVRYK